MANLSDLVDFALTVAIRYKKELAEWKKKFLISFSTQPLRKVCIANRNIGQFCLK